MTYMTVCIRSISNPTLEDTYMTSYPMACILGDNPHLPLHYFPWLNSQQRHTRTKCKLAGNKYTTVDLLNHGQLWSLQPSPDQWYNFLFTYTNWDMTYNMVTIMVNLKQAPPSSEPSRGWSNIAPKHGLSNPPWCTCWHPFAGFSWAHSNWKYSSTNPTKYIWQWIQNSTSHIKA